MKTKPSTRRSRRICSRLALMLLAIAGCRTFNMTPEELEANQNGQFHWNPNVTVYRRDLGTPQGSPPDYQKLIAGSKAGRR